MTKPLKHSLLVILLAGYTAFAAGPFVWVAIMSLRTTSEIMADQQGSRPALSVDATPLMLA